MKALEPTRHEVDAKTDIGESHDPAHHKNNERADNDWKNKPGLAFHCLTPRDVNTTVQGNRSDLARISYP